ncbi:S9 family peptidase [soil metagenome]
MSPVYTSGTITTLNPETLMNRLLLVFAGMLAAMTLNAADKRAMTLDDLYALKRVADPQISPDGTAVVYQVTEITDVATNKKHTHLWVAATDGKTPPRQLTSSGKSDSHPRWSPDSSKILFESTRSGSQQLWLLDVKTGGEAIQLTTISTGAGTGIWSPDGSHIAFVSAIYPEFSSLPFAESDKKNKEKNDAIEASPVKAKTFTKLFYRHWDEYVGDKRQHLFVVDLKNRKPHDATPGDRDAYPTSTTFSIGDDFTFSPDNKHLVFTAVPVKGESWTTNYDLCRVTLDNTKTEWETLTKDNLAADGAPQFSPDGKKLAWRAQKKAGYEADKWDIMVVATKPDGTFEGPAANWTASKDISAGEFIWESPSKIVFTADYKARTPVCTCTAEGVKIFEDDGMVGSLSMAKDMLVYTQAYMNAPAEVYLHAFKKGGEPVNLSKANTAALAKLDVPRPQSVQVKIEDGEMQMWVLKPPGFDAKKKWPVVYLIHGGPQGAWEDGWSWRWCPQLWAAQGYVVVMPNPRGSTGFGQKFTDQIGGDWGGKCYRDLLAGMEYIKSQPYMDKDRIASAGASFGGYMQNWFAVNDIAKDLKCQINHCSVWNFESMWGTTDELWFDEYEHGGLPWEIPGKYREFSPHAKAGNLAKNKVPMLIIHNDLDFRCPIGQGHELFSALQRQGVPSRFVNFPDECHWVLKPANSKHWHNEVFGWLKQYCPPGGK